MGLLSNNLLTAFRFFSFNLTAIPGLQLKDLSFVKVSKRLDSIRIVLTGLRYVKESIVLEIVPN